MTVALVSIGNRGAAQCGCRILPIEKNAREQAIKALFLFDLIASITFIVLGVLAHNGTLAMSPSGSYALIGLGASMIGLDIILFISAAICIQRDQSHNRTTQPELVAESI